MWQILLLILSITLYSGENSMPTKHFLYEIFQQRNEVKKGKGFTSVSEKAIIKEINPSSSYREMGCLILAGGQGTRLGIDGPKGCVALPLKEKKTLFQLIFEKVRKKGAALSVAIMTSPLNHEATVHYLEEHHFFGLTNVSIFSQEMVPICDDEGALVYEDNGEISSSPDGNGKALKHLYHSGIWEKWKEKGIKWVQVLPVDNPLADPFDGEFLAIHEKERVDLVLKCIRRETPEEKLGVVGVADGKLMIREYSELTKRMKDLGFPLGNTGLFSCSMDFVKQSASIEMPWHLARKEGGKEKVWVWKFETFIFDLFPYANSFKVILSERKKCFAPLKNASGPDSLETVAQAVMTEKP